MRTVVYKVHYVPLFALIVGVQRYLLMNSNFEWKTLASKKRYDLISFSALKSLLITI